MAAASPAVVVRVVMVATPTAGNSPFMALIVGGCGADAGGPDLSALISRPRQLPSRIRYVPAHVVLSAINRDSNTESALSESEIVALKA